MSARPRLGAELILRAPGEADAEGVHEILMSPHVVRGTMRVPGSPLSTTRERLSPAPGTHQLVAVDDDRIAGFGELVRPADERMLHGAEINMVAVHSEWLGRGVGRALAEALVDLGDNWLNLTRIGLIVFADNEPAIALYESLGFEHEGTMRRLGYGDGRWMDARVMGRIRE
jgi:putative acetyltransferase